MKNNLGKSFVGLLIAGLISIGQIGHAQDLEPPEFPKVSRVVQLSEGDELKIRLEPNASAEELGALQSRAFIEVTGANEDGSWSRVNIEERTGWVATRFIEDVRIQRMKQSELPGRLQCFGTEPFWSLDLTKDTSHFKTADGEDRETELAWADHAYFDASKVLLETTDYLGLVTYENCSDGMSDRSFAMTITLFIKGELGSIGGCCAIDLR